MSILKTLPRSSLSNAPARTKKSCDLDGLHTVTFVNPVSAFLQLIALSHYAKYILNEHYCYLVLSFSCLWSNIPLNIHNFIIKDIIFRMLCSNRSHRCWPLVDAVRQLPLCKACVCVIAQQLERMRQTLKKKVMQLQDFLD